MNYRIKGASKESIAVLTYITEISIKETSIVINSFNICTVKTFYFGLKINFGVSLVVG